jgi:uncharacterized membrane protein YqjE
MNPPAINTSQTGGASKRFTKRLLALGENRLVLLMVEMQEERQHLLRILFLALTAAGFGLIAGILLTIAIVVEFWNTSPVAALLVLTCFYSVAAFLVTQRLILLQRNWKFLPGTIDQLQKDRACLEKILA